MGLFGFGARKEALEKELMQSMSQLPILDLLIANLLDDKERKWITQAASYYDNCRRTVTIGPDTFAIDKDGDKDTYVFYNYTSAGYVPLHSHVGENGLSDISEKRVCFLWARVVQERMVSSILGCRVGEVYEDEGSFVKFSYTVPPQSFRDWF